MRTSSLLGVVVAMTFTWCGAFCGEPQPDEKTRAAIAELRAKLEKPIAVDMVDMNVGRALELMAIVAFLGNAEGLLFSTPGVLRMTAGSWALAPLLAAWVLYGAVMSLAQGRLLGLERSLPRLLLLGANWFILAAPAMLIAGAFLGIGELQDAGESIRGLVSPAMARWGGPLAVAGLSGCCLHFWLALMTGRSRPRDPGVWRGWWIVGGG